MEAVQRFWTAISKEQQNSSATLECLICGQPTPGVRRLPFKVKGVPGGQPSGMAIISFNNPAFESYGLEESLNAPTCPDCGERFTKAANRLIADESTHLYLGRSVYLFWCKEEVGFNPAKVLSQPDPQVVRNLLLAAFSGKGRSLSADTTPFYSVALSASAARVVVRGWLETTVGEAKKNLARYFAAQELCERDGSPGGPISIVALALSTARDSKDLSARTSEGLLRLALSGSPLPWDMLFQAVKRNRAEQGPTRARAALIKMVLLTQNADWKGERKMTELDSANTAPAYICGRLLAVLESVQRSAIPGLNATITDKFYGSASSAPASVFGNLIHGAQAHLSKLRKTRPGAHEAIQQRMEAILRNLTEFPHTLSLYEQGQFALGYYHQKAADRAAALAYKQSPEPESAKASGV